MQKWGPIGDSFSFVLVTLTSLFNMYKIKRMLTVKEVWSGTESKE